MKKHIKITSTSNISWKDAIVQAVTEVSKTIHNLESLEILEQKANIRNNSITEYFVLLSITFEIDQIIRDEKCERKDFNNGK